MKLIKKYGNEIQNFEFEKYKFQTIGLNRKYSYLVCAFTDQPFRTFEFESFSLEVQVV